MVGHDPTLIGWPWVAETHSWLEPTALAILALCREGLGDHPRVRQGVSLILDRAIPSGGWNYGNRAVFGRTLRPQPGPTGLALLALAARGESTPAVPAAIDYLHWTLTESPSRGLARLGRARRCVRTTHVRPQPIPGWRKPSISAPRRPDATLGLAVLLLAAGDGALAAAQACRESTSRKRATIDETADVLDGDGRSGCRRDGGASGRRLARARAGVRRS